MALENKIVFTSIPKLSELKYFTAVIDFNKENENILSYYNWQKIRTRHLLEKYENILAAPIERRPNLIHLIVPVDFTLGRGLLNLAEDTKLSLIGPHSLDNNIYLECIAHTFRYRMSPEWIQLSEYFVKFRDFLNYEEPMDAVYFNLLITVDDCLALTIRAHKIKLPSLSLTDLEVDIKQLFNEGYVPVHKKVYILPQLKLATAVGVYLNIPTSCPFKNYSEIRNHWKMTYGYNLPEGGMLFIEVTFGWNKHTYLYPLICVCPYEIIHFKNKNEITTICDFLESLKTKFPKICGQPVRINIISDTILRPISKQYLASEVIDNPYLSKLVTNNDFIQEFQKEENSKPFVCVSKRSKYRSCSPPLFFPKFGRSCQPFVTSKPEEEKFRCSAIFTPKTKVNSKSTIQGLSKSQQRNLHIRNSKSQKCNGFQSSTHSSKSFISYQEVEILARSKNLKKMTVPAMIYFCTKNSIPFSPKDRKEALMQKIYDFF